MTGQDRGISERDYRGLCAFVRAECGIEFAEGKRLMVEGRLHRRARALGIGSLSEYCDYLRTKEGEERERPYLIDAVTTHKTDFYREPAHFDYLAEYAIPELVRTTGAGVRRPMEIWSSACSTGEEPYTLAMVLSEYARASGGESFHFHVTGSDISLPVIETAHAGVYRREAVTPLPQAFHRYLLRSRDRARGLVRIAPEIRSTVEFRQINLMAAGYGFREPADIVFCRNVMIYFDRATRADVLARIAATMRSGGYLFMGHSESLCGFSLPLRQVSTTVYRRTND